MHKQKLSSTDPPYGCELNKPFLPFGFIEATADSFELMHKFFNYIPQTKGHLEKKSYHERTKKYMQIERIL